jgi:hypothetical protein
MKPIRETDKAIALTALITTQKRSKTNTYTELIWIPKSQIFDNRVALWVVNQKINEFRDVFSQKTEVFIKLLDADETEVETIVTDNEIKRNEEYQAKCKHLFLLGKLKHDALYSKAKQLGIKGIRKDMKTTTLERLIANI